MKKLLFLSTIALGIFALVGTVSASPADSLQPATSLIVEDELQVLGTARAYSVRIGAQGYGGVTFFNGTIINETTDADTGAEMPITFGDDVRVDGELFRTEVGGDHPIKLSDTIRPQVSATYDLGTSSNEFRHGYFSGNITVGNLLGTGVVGSGNITNGAIATADLADSSVTGTKIATGTIVGSDISSSADLSVDTGTFAGDITAHGNIIQDLTDYGAIKATLIVMEDGSCPSASIWTYNNSSVTCAADVAIPSDGVSSPTTYAGTRITFDDFDIYGRYIQISAMTPNPRIATYNIYALDHSLLSTHVYDEDGADANSVVTITVY